MRNLSMGPVVTRSDGYMVCSVLEQVQSEDSQPAFVEVAYSVFDPSGLFKKSFKSIEAAEDFIREFSHSESQPLMGKR